MQDAVARLDAERGAHGRVVGLALGHGGIIRRRRGRHVARHGGDLRARAAAPRRLARVALDHLHRVARLGPRQRIERQAVAHRRGAGDEQQPVGAQLPDAREPRPARLAGVAQERQRVADDLVEAVAVKRRELRAVLRRFRLRVERGDVVGQLVFLDEVVVGVLVARRARSRRSRPSRLASRRAKRPACSDRRAVVVAGLGDELVVLPDRLAVEPPVAAVGPARQHLARDTICPGRNGAASRRSRTCRAGAAAVPRP